MSTALPQRAPYLVEVDYVLGHCPHVHRSEHRDFYGPRDGCFSLAALTELAAAAQERPLRSFYLYHLPKVALDFLEAFLD